jgi:hypothetical protein
MRNRYVALKAIELVRTQQSLGMLPHILCAMDVRRAIATIIMCEVESRLCDPIMKLCMTEFRQEWA